MFHRSSFKQASFRPVSWRFDGTDTRPLAGGPDEPLGAARQRTDYDHEELFQIAIALVMSGALDN